MTHIIHKTIKSRADGLELSVLEIAPEGKLRGIVQLVHGMSENKERYQPFMEYLAAEGFLTVIHDHRGHGASVRQKQDLGYMYGGGAEALLDDISLINETLRKKYPELPLILFGHSMGSLAVRSFVKEHDDCVDALIVCGSPSRNPALPLGRFLGKKRKTAFWRPPCLPFHRIHFLRLLCCPVFGREKQVCLGLLGPESGGGLCCL